MTTITVITGANKGLGYETARRLTELGHTVIIGARDPGRGQAGDHPEGPVRPWRATRQQLRQGACLRRSNPQWMLPY